MQTRPQSPRAFHNARNGTIVYLLPGDTQPNPWFPMNLPLRSYPHYGVVVINTRFLQEVRLLEHEKRELLRRHSDNSSRPSPPSISPSHSLLPQNQAQQTLYQLRQMREAQAQYQALQAMRRAEMEQRHLLAMDLHMTQQMHAQNLANLAWGNQLSEQVSFNVTGGWKVNPATGVREYHEGYL